MGFGQFFCGGTILVELGKPVFVDGSALQDERLANHQLYLGEGFRGPLEQGVEIILIGLDRAVVPAVEAMPDVVDPDENAQHVGLEIEAVLVPAVGQLVNLVAGNSAVVGGKLVTGVRNQELRGGHPGVSLAKGFLLVRLGILLVASGVRNGVALEKNDASFLEGSLGLPCVMSCLGVGSERRRDARKGGAAEDLPA